tara:strand:+ start:156 stop:491 length:336 start_codon:yes stop_codon:yes gene_type:complete
MAKAKIELKLSDWSVLNKFVAWYAEEYSTISPTKRKMKGKVNEFLIKFLEVCCDGESNSSSRAQKLKVFEDFAQVKNKSEEEIEAERALKGKPEELKEWKRINKLIKSSKK